MNHETAREIAEELDRLGYIDNRFVNQRKPWQILDEVAGLITKRSDEYTLFLENAISKAQTGKCPNCQAVIRPLHCCVCEGCDGCREREVSGG